MRRARADGTKRKNDTEVSEMVGLTKSEIENLLKVRTNGFLNSTAADAKKLQETLTEARESVDKSIETKLAALAKCSENIQSKKSKLSQLKEATKSARSKFLDKSDSLQKLAQAMELELRNDLQNIESADQYA